MNIDYDIVWEEMILDYYKDKSDDELKVILIEALEEFFKKNPDWYKVSPDYRIRFNPDS